jgi:hypothetical protein
VCLKKWQGFEVKLRKCGGGGQLRSSKHQFFSFIFFNDGPSTAKLQVPKHELHNQQKERTWKNSAGERSACLTPLNAKLNPICHLLALLGAHHIFHVSRIRVNRRKRRLQEDQLAVARLTLFGCEQILILVTYTTTVTSFLF